MSFADHLQTAATHVCRCWAVVRRDGTTFGFTDHDQTLSFDGTSFTPQGGMTGRAVLRTSGLAPDQSEALGVLSADAITEEDIAAGRYDGAEVTLWQVVWDDVSARRIQFRASLGEITRAAGGFTAELLGLSAPLNQPQGRSYLKTCGAVLGDARCGVDTSDPDYRLDTVLAAQSTGTAATLLVVDQAAHAAGWFGEGQVLVRSGRAIGLTASIRSDVIIDGHRQLTLWAPLALAPVAGDSLRLTAGCDKQPGTCRDKFSNFINFRGFPDLPGGDFVVSVPRSSQANTGGSLTR